MYVILHKYSIDSDNAQQLDFNQTFKPLIIMINSFKGKI